jgi:integrase
MPSEGPPRDRRVNWREIRKVCRRLGYITGQPPITLSQEVAYAWLLALRTAMRSGELLGLTVEAVNLQTRVARLDVHKTVRYTGRARFVPFTKHAARLFAVMVKGKKGELFRVSDQSRDVLFRKATKACGVVGMRFHDSRAEALTLLSRRVDLLTLQKISGHTDINQLSSAYYRETPEQVAARL